MNGSDGAGEHRPPLTRGWGDLTPNRPGQAARRQALAARQRAPVRTVLARMLGAHTDERAWRVGADGEALVGARLERLPDGWCVLNAIPVGDRGADIDHLVIGPGGVFTLNTKHHPNGKVWVAEKGLLVNGRRTDYLRNARFEASRAAKLLSRACGQTLPVTPVIVVIAAKLTVKAAPEGVVVVGLRRIDRYLATRPSTLSPDVVDLIFAHARRDTTWTSARKPTA